MICNNSDLIFVRFYLYESKGDQKYCIWGVKEIFSGFALSNPSGRYMYAITCKASYKTFWKILIEKMYDWEITEIKKIFIENTES